jgi:hypothetical protein
MRRRQFLCGLGSVVATWPLTARAQQAPAKIYRIGILSLVQRPSEGALRQALRDLGYVEGRNVVYESRYGGGSVEQLAAGAEELVQLMACTRFHGHRD